MSMDLVNKFKNPELSKFFIASVKWIRTFTSFPLDSFPPKAIQQDKYKSTLVFNILRLEGTFIAI